MRGQRLSVGMFYPAGPEPPTRSTILGAAVAVKTFLPMLARHADPRLAITAYVDGDAAAVARQLRRVAGQRQLEVRSLDRLATLDERVLPSVWHDINADVRRPFALRHAAATTATPISITHHTVSYTFLVHDWYLPLLLGDVRAYDSIVCTSQAARTTIANVLEQLGTALERAHGLRPRYRGRLDVVPLGVDVELFRPQSRPAVRRRLRLPRDRKIVLWLGRFSARDKADLLPLLAVFARIAHRAPARARPLLILAGTDRRHDSAYFTDYAERLGIGDAVRIVQTIESTDRRHWLAAADVFVSPVDSIQESFGLSPIEAMACGTPAIVSDWNGYKDTVVDGETGFRIATRWARCDGDINAIAPVIFETMLDHLAFAQSVAIDVDQLEERLATLLRDDELRQRMGRAARARAVTEYAWKRVVAGYEALWHDQLAQAGRGRFRPRPEARWSLFPTFDAFGHYATETIDTRTRLVATELASAVLEGRELLPVYHADDGVLSADVLEHALAKLAASGRRGMSLGALATAIGTTLTRDAAVRHAMWLLKYGHARVAR